MRRPKHLRPDWLRRHSATLARLAGVRNIVDKLTGFDVTRIMVWTKQ